VRGGPGHKKAILTADLKPDEEMMVAEASYPLRGATIKERHHGVRRPGCKSPRHTIRQVENFAKRIDSRSGDPNIHVC
jgi:hypothetical protein